jgi:hypothetical protein
MWQFSELGLLLQRGSGMEIFANSAGLICNRPVHPAHHASFSRRHQSKAGTREFCEEFLYGIRRQHSFSMDPLPLNRSRPFDLRRCADIAVSNADFPV